MWKHPGSLPLNFVADCRLKTDPQLDEHEGGTHVLDLYNAGRTHLSSGTYHSSKRFAMFDYREAETASREVRDVARQDLRKVLLSNQAARVTIVIPTADLSEDGSAQKAETICWGVFGAPDSMANMRGCFYEWAKGRYVCPIYAPSGALKELQKWEMGHWMRRALQLGNSLRGFGKEPALLTPRRMATEMLKDHAQHAMLMALDVLRENNLPLAVDIENIEASGTITAIGLSDGIQSISIPWEPFVPHGRTDPEPGVLAGGLFQAGPVAEQVAQLLAGPQPKALHNHTFDIPRLQAKGLKVGGRIEDTFAASAIAHPELRHGLQAACSTCIPEAIPPWKSLWHPKLKGISRDDIEYWTCDPVALRDYNARDAFYTWHLAKNLLPKVGRCWA